MYQRREVRGFFKRVGDDQGGYRWSVNEYADPEEFARKLDAQLREVIRSLTGPGATALKIAAKPVGPQVPHHYLRWLREENTRIPLLGLDPKKPHTARLPQIYVSALTEAEASYNQGHVRALMKLLQKKAGDKWALDKPECLKEFVKTIDALKPH